MASSPQLLQGRDFVNVLKPRSPDWHKGLSGHVLIIGGAPGFSGAPLLAARAALRVGAGLVSIATHPHHAATLNLNTPEIMCHGIQDLAQLETLCAKAKVIVLGPGLGQSDWSHQLWDFAIQQSVPLIVDADALNILAHHRIQQNWILTPHMGEAARLLANDIDTIEHDRLKLATHIQKKYGGFCVLKGHHTLILGPEAAFYCDKGNPGMATAGMGDILSGVLGALVAQDIPLFQAAKLGVYLHALAGDLAATEGERGTIATDLLLPLRQLVNDATLYER